jgi:hypothetical protein
MIVRVSILLLGFVFMVPAVVQAQAQAATMETSRGVALGTGVRASALSGAALLYNAASMPLARTYHIEGTSSYEPQAGRLSVMAAAVDSMLNEHFSAGLAARAIFSDGEQGYSGFDGRVGVAVPIADAVGIGLAGRYVNLSGEGVPEGQEDTAPDGFTMDASLRVSLAKVFHISGMIYNFIDLESALAPITVGGSASVQLMESLTFGGDVLFDLTTYDSAQSQIGGGVEYLANGAIPIRAGYFYDAGLEVHALSGGLGYVSRTIGVEVALRQQISGENDTFVMMTLRYFVY